MFEATINDTKNWRNSVEAISSLIDEGTLQIDQDGLKLRAMDPSQIALVDFELPSSSFDKFSCESQMTVGVDFTELSKITKRCKGDDKIELSIKDNKFKIVFRGETRRQFTTAIIDSTSNPPKQPNIEFTSDVKISPNMLKDALKDAELVSNHVALSLEKGLSVRSDGDTGSVDVQFPEDKLLAVNVSEASRSVFSLEYLNNILKAADAPSVVNISLRTDAPLKVEYSIGDGRVIYYLAPRIES